MLTTQQLKTIVIKHQQDLQKDLGVKRQFQLKNIPKFATIVSGVRRCGKSTIIRQHLAKTPLVYYVYFEDIALAQFTVDDFERLETAFSETLGSNGTYFFDEIQNVQGWELYVRQLVDQGRRVFITGSNASMLSRELGTRLTGRNLRYELYPFSFEEFLLLHKLKPSASSFERYLLQGGFPEYLKTQENDVLRNLFEDIIYRDIVVRNDIRHEASLKSLLSVLSSNIGKELSYNKLKDVIQVSSTNTVSQFIEACESAYLFFRVKKFSHSLKKQIINPKKIYCIDNALIRLNTFSTSPDRGRLLENAVFIELRRRAYEVFYFKENYECDFVARKDNKIEHLIQVCYDVNNENKSREIHGLVQAMSALSQTKGLVLTYNQEDRFIIDGKTIVLMPVWKWMSGG